MRRSMLVFIVVILVRNGWAVGAGGFANQVVGTRAMGMGNAFSAVADDPSAVFFNPAALTTMDGTRATVGLAPHFPSSDYEGPSGGVHMDPYTPVVPNLYLTDHSPDKRWALGFGMFAPYGLHSLWPSDGPFRYVTTESDLQIPMFSPAVGVKVSDTLSFGMGLIYARAKAELKSALPVDLINQGDPFYGPPAGALDGEQIMEGDGDGFGVNTGVLFRPTPQHSFALTYRSDVKINLNGTVAWKGLSNESAAGFGGSEYVSDVESSITLPPSVTAGYAFRRAKLTLAADAEWVGYSSYRSTDLEFPAGSNFPYSSTPREYKDKWSVSGGANYALNEMWETRAGYSFYPAVVPEGTWDPSVPDSDTHGFHAGATMKVKSFGVDLSYSYFKYNTVTINNGVGSETLSTVNGTYKTSAQIVSANVSYRFR